jgi:hypothetical protein
MRARRLWRSIRKPSQVVILESKKLRPSRSTSLQSKMTSKLLTRIALALELLPTQFSLTLS